MLNDYVEAITPNGFVEIFNNARTAQYAKAYNISAVKDCACSCATLLACDQGPYVCKLDEDTTCLSEAELNALGICGNTVIPISANNPGAPWWDDSNPGSFDYVGAYVLGSSGWNSTYKRETITNSLSGFSFGAPVRGGRCITYDIVLIARSQAGLEAGFAYEDEKMTNLEECGFFTLGLAVDCPGIDHTEEQVNKLRRYIRRATVSSGLEMISTRVTGCCSKACCHFKGGAFYGQAQVTFCSEQAWLYTEPYCCFDEQDFPLEEAACNYSFINKSDQEPPIYATRSILMARPRFNVEITRDGKICKVGDWTWAETQLGGGPGLVVLTSEKSVPEYQLTERQVPSPEKATTEKETCNVYNIDLFYDVANDIASYPGGPSWFEARGWSHTPGTPLPCGDEIKIIGVYTRNDSYDSAPAAQDAGVNNPTVNSKWTYSTSVNQGKEDGTDCCYVKLEFNSSTTGGQWFPCDEFGNVGSWDPAGRDYFTQDQNFPPEGCNLVIYTGCPDQTTELVEADLPEYYDGVVGYSRVAVLGPVSYSADGTWISKDGKSGCLPGFSCVPGTNQTHLAPKVAKYYDGAIDGYTRVGVLGPVEYFENRSWLSADGIAGCLPGFDCTIGPGEEFLVPKIENADAFDDCEGSTECPVTLLPDLTEQSDGTWIAPKNTWFHDVVLEFPQPKCNYEITNSQSENDVYLDEEYQINPGSCNPESTETFMKIFPSFESDCWKPVYIPHSEMHFHSNCFCAPIVVVKKCCVYTNPSSTYSAVGSIVVKTGGAELKNFRLRAWVSPFRDEKTPCEDFNLWASRTVDFGLEVAHLPGGTLLRIDGETRQGILEFPGGRSEPAIRYVTGYNSQNFEFIEIGPCESIYVLAEADEVHTAENFTLSMCFSNRYGASGGLLRA